MLLLPDSKLTTGFSKVSSETRKIDPFRLFQYNFKSPLFVINFQITCAFITEGRGTLGFTFVCLSYNSSDQHCMSERWYTKCFNSNSVLPRSFWDSSDFETLLWRRAAASTSHFHCILHRLPPGQIFVFWNGRWGNELNSIWEISLNTHHSSEKQQLCCSR